MSVSSINDTFQKQIICMKNLFLKTMSEGLDISYFNLNNKSENVNNHSDRRHFTDFNELF